MTTLAQVREAHQFDAEHRFALRKHLLVDQSLATPEDMKLVEAIREARTPEEFDAAIHSLAVNRLFVRGVIYVGEKK